MSDPVVAVLFALIIIIGLLGLANMIATIGALDRVKKIEDKGATKDPNPIKTFISEAQALNERLIAEEMERTSADE